MWFKNLQVYRFTQPFSLSTEDLNLALAAHAFKPCSSQEPASYGWVEPLGRSGKEYIHAANGYIMVCAKRQEKILPASVVNEKLAEHAQLIAEKEQRKISRKEKVGLKEEIIFELLPKAFTRSILQFAYIDSQRNLLVVNSSSAKRAEELINALRDALGSVPVIPLAAKNIPTQSMTQWLLDNCPKGFTLGGECELTDTQEKGSRISCKEQNLMSSEIHSHLQTGMTVTRLGIEWKDRLTCVIDEKLAIKKLKFSDLIQEQAAENSEDAVQQFDSDFAIMTVEITHFLADLIKALGGELAE
jgi:recombination associated protein RdgC